MTDGRALILAKQLSGSATLSLWLLAIGLFPVHAQEPSAKSEESPIDKTGWQYGAYADLSYPVDFNFPENHLFRSRTTTPRVNELTPNMGLVYVRKGVSARSPWGMEFGVQGGYDSKNFAFLPGEPKVGGADTLRHFSRANVSYLVPGGRGLTMTAGLFNSLIGYESLYAKDNFNYTRSWMADNTPYMMFGVNARYPINERVTATLFIVNSYYHLAYPNRQPSYGAQAAWKPRPRLNVTSTLYYGPDQSNTSLEFWRAYSNTIVEWKGDEVTVAFSYDVGTEKVAGLPGTPQTFVTAGALFTRWHITGPWSLAVRPEFYWDRYGRWTGSRQLVTAITTTLEYRFPFASTNTILRLEHRYDESTGLQGGFFTGGNVSPGVPGLAHGQHLLILALLWTFDSP